MWFVHDKNNMLMNFARIVIIHKSIGFLACAQIKQGFARPTRGLPIPFDQGKGAWQPNSRYRFANILRITAGAAKEQQR